MTHRLSHQRTDGEVVLNVAIAVDQAVLAVRGVGVQRHVGNDTQLR